MDIALWGKRTGLIEMKTWRGKGNLLIKLIAYFQEPTLILVHNQKTLTEMKTKFKTFSNREIGERWSKKKNMWEIMVTTHQSFRDNVWQFAGKFGIIFYDEADWNLSKQMIETLCVCDSDWLFWLTGTPKRQELDINDLQLVFWPHIKSPTVLNNWYTLIPQIYQLKYDTKVCSFDDWHDLKRQLIHEKERIERQVAFVKKVNSQIGTALFLVDRVEECTLYNKLFTECWLPNVIVNWKTKLADDEKNIKQMIEQKGIVIGTAQKIWRGVDIPAVQAIFLFYPTRFDSNVIQAVWRALRSYPWKEKVFLFDRCDSVLWKQGNTRKEIYKKEYPSCIIKTSSVTDLSFT